MLDDIIKLIKDAQYSEALNLIKSELVKKFDLSDSKGESEYKELLKLRITCLTMLGEDDALILDQIRKEKYPSIMSYDLEGKLKVNLIFKNQFNFNCDAYVNTVDVNEPFQNVSDNSATSEFLKRIGSNKVFAQVNSQKNKKAGSYITLDHPELSAPMSYHILYYEVEDKINDSYLEEGIGKVLDNSIKENHKSISFFPLGYNIVAKANKADRTLLAEKLANKIAEIIVTYYFENKSKKFPEIYFNFVTVLTMMTFDRAFSKWCKYDKSQINQMKHLPIKERLFIESLFTRDLDYINSLKSIFHIIRERNTILLLGETGVGKSHLAKMIYENSNRNSNPFIELNCALIKPENIYSQLFGWKKGSFTDAKDDGIGAVQAAEGGVLFLDEIGYTDIDVQQMLLKFLDDGVYSRYGENEVQREANVKLIFGTNVNIEERIMSKTFARDFYERINQYCITIPPLRQRQDDISPLVNSFLEKLNKVNSQNIIISESVIEKLKTYNWPGNVRQLKNYLEKIYLLAKHNNELTVTENYLNTNPPRNNLIVSDDPISNLESALKILLQRWDPSEGNLSESLVQPILAKIYLEDLNGKKEDAMKFIGLDGTRGKSSSLIKKSELYTHLKNKN